MSNTLTASQVQDIKTRIGLSQTAYALNNAPGISLRSKLMLKSME